jgi:hypothetical protein
MNSTVFIMKTTTVHAVTKVVAELIGLERPYNLVAEDHIQAFLSYEGMHGQCPVEFAPWKNTADTQMVLAALNAEVKYSEEKVTVTYKLKNGSSISTSMLYTPKTKSNNAATAMSVKASALRLATKHLCEDLLEQDILAFKDAE